VLKGISHEVRVSGCLAVSGLTEEGLKSLHSDRKARLSPQVRLREVKHNAEGTPHKWGGRTVLKTQVDVDHRIQGGVREPKGRMSRIGET